MIQAGECLLYKDTDALLGGFDQAKVLTNTIEPNPGQLPNVIRNRSVQLPENIDQLVIKLVKL